MVKPHEGTIALRNGFDKVWKALGKKGEANLRTDKKGTPFIAKAGIAQKGPHRGRRVIFFFEMEQREPEVMNVVGVITSTVIELE